MSRLRHKTHKRSSPKRSRKNFQHKVILPLSVFEDIRSVKTQGTSDFYKAIYHDTPFFLKNVIKNRPGKRTNEFGVSDIELATNELLASLLYSEIFHTPTIRLYLVFNDLKDPSFPLYLIASKIEEIDDCSVSSKSCKDLYSNKVSFTMEPFFVDCVMANWDVGWKGNTVVDKRSGNAVRLDVGGALLYRALGGPRDFSKIPKEHLTFLDPRNVSSRLFKTIRPEQIKDSFRLLRRAKIDSLDSLKTRILKELGVYLSPRDLKKAKEVIRFALSIVKARTKYYLKYRKDIEEEMEEILV